jgi:cytochrome c biogenesis protein CcmG, thiol:disulfide interchange protein DsbE
VDFVPFGDGEKGMAKQIWVWSPLVVLFVLCFLLWQGMRLDPHKVPSNLIAQPLPMLTFKRLNNDSVTTTQLIGNVDLLHVWASWCLTCRQEHLFLLQLAKRHHLRIAGLIYHDSVANIQQWLQERGDPYQMVLFDPNGDGILALGIYGTPETFIVDQHGIILHKHIGDINPRNWPDLIKYLPKLKAAI